MVKKLSLAALIAMGSMSVATATPLEDAIKNVDVSGYFRYRLTKKNDTSASHEYKAVIGFTKNITDDVKVKFTTVGKTISNGTGADQETTFGIKELYGIYKNNALTVKAGEMGIATPLTDHTADFGTGVVACYNVAGVKVVGAGFANSNIAAGNNIYALAAIGSADMVKYDVWAFKVNNAVDNEIFANVSANLGAVSVIAQYAYQNPKAGKDQTFAGLAAATSVSNVNLTAAALHFGKDGAGVELGSDDSELLKAGEQAADLIGTSTLKDGNALAAVVSTNVSGVKVGADLVLVKDAIGGNGDASELVLRAGKKIAKNFNLKGYYSNLRAHGLGYSRKIRVEAKYSF